MKLSIKVSKLDVNGEDERTWEWNVPIIPLIVIAIAIHFLLKYVE